MNSYSCFNHLAKATSIFLGLVTLLPAMVSCTGLMKPAPYPSVLYIGWDGDSRSQIYRLEANGAPSQLTDLESDIIDFAVSPDATRLAFTALEANGTSSIMLVNVDGDQVSQILSCLEAECSQSVWALDSRRLIYERRPIGEDRVPGSPFLWWLDTETGETVSVLDDQDVRGMAAGFSPDGEWLSYSTPEDEGTHIYNLKDGRSHFVPEGIGVPGAWSPTSDRIIIPNLDLVIVHGDEGDDHLEHSHDYQTAVQLFSLEVDGGDLEPIGEALNVDDSVPTWSPGAEWIAFGRRLAGASTGRQLWLMRPDGSDAQALTEEFSLNHGPPFWSPDGRYLLFQRHKLDDPESEPSIWIMDIDTGNATRLATSGMQPAWVAEATAN